MSQVSSSAEEGSGSSGEGGGSSREGDGSSVVKSSLEEAAPLAWHSIWVNLNPSALNNILSYEEGSWKLMHARGDGQQAGCLIERFPSGAAFVLPPYVFRQVRMCMCLLCACACASVYICTCPLSSLRTSSGSPIWATSTRPRLTLPYFSLPYLRQANLGDFDAIVAQVRATAPPGWRLVHAYPHACLPTCTHACTHACTCTRAGPCSRPSRLAPRRVVRRRWCPRAVARTGMRVGAVLRRQSAAGCIRSFSRDARGGGAWAHQLPGGQRSRAHRRRPWCGHIHRYQHKKSYPSSTYTHTCTCTYTHTYTHM